MLDHMLPQSQDQRLVDSFESVLDHVDHVPKGSKHISSFDGTYFLPVFAPVGLRSTAFNCEKAYSMGAPA